ncbi:hypothetical protein, partial [[Clostridium] innocuum]|uniref:hypothetical protein n=1 Tax=Clostridium innocuum TaxID=1522 RepID=UPI003A4E1BCB
YKKNNNCQPIPSSFFPLPHYLVRLGTTFFINVSFSLCRKYYKDIMWYNGMDINHNKGGFLHEKNKTRSRMYTPVICNGTAGLFRQ